MHINRHDIESIIDGATDLTLATLRPDGYPQATTISYAHDGLTLYAAIGKESQKARNIGANDKVSLTINLPYHDWREIKGLSMAARAHLLTDGDELRRAEACLRQRFPQISQWADSEIAAHIVMLKIVPQVISVLDYSQEFGHTELIEADALGNRDGQA